MTIVRRIAAGVVDVGSIAAVALTAHTAYNLTRLASPSSSPPPVPERVSILIPARNEAHRISACIAALIDQRGLPDVEFLVVDDESEDGTGDLVRALTAEDPRWRIIDGAPRPRGWLGKPWACAQLAGAATGSVLVFVDADVQIEPHGIAASVELLRAQQWDCVCPYPRQIAVTPGERLVQPLLQWSWLTTLPLGLASSSRRPSLTAANGQLMLVDTKAYRAAGGHAVVRQEVLDDIALMRALKVGGGRGGVADGTRIASCRMYQDWDDLREGYTKSLWSAFGSPAGALAAVGGLSAIYVAPAVAALTGRRTALAGVAAGAAGRIMVARRTGGRVWPDAFTHPASIATLGYLTARSFAARRAGRLTWKGRSLSE